MGAALASFCTSNLQWDAPVQQQTALVVVGSGSTDGSMFKQICAQHLTRR
jgi:hypothetical protein